ncbi:hypothetical protein F4809DRAFT_612487, partial [Biscogniauxia mediterranea]
MVYFFPRIKQTPAITTHYLSTVCFLFFLACFLSSCVIGDISSEEKGGGGGGGGIYYYTIPTYTFCHYPLPTS